MSQMMMLPSIEVETAFASVSVYLRAVIGARCILYELISF